MSTFIISYFDNATSRLIKINVVIKNQKKIQEKSWLIQTTRTVFSHLSPGRGPERDTETVDKLGSLGRQLSGVTTY